MKIKRPVGRRPKYSYKQMWNYASRSKQGSKKQVNWVRRIYKQKIREATRKGQSRRVEWLKSKRKNIKRNVKKFGVRRQQWQVASEKDLLDLALEGVYNQQQGKLLILDESNNAIMIAYEGTAEFDEAMKLKQQVFGKGNYDKFIK